MKSRKTLSIALASVLVFAVPLQGQIKQSSASGFMIQIERELEGNAQQAYEKLVQDFSIWYDANHSYSGKAENLSIDLDKRCMLEQLPEGGFVSHMELVFHQPGKMLRLTGGLGPLQEMGVSGALTFGFKDTEKGAIVTMTYYVSGADFLQLDKIAKPVNQVLGIQLDRFQKHCAGQLNSPKAD